MKDILRIKILLVITLWSTFSFSQVKDVEGNEYKTVKIGNQHWMAEDLYTHHYSNGDEITFLNGETEWRTHHATKKPTGALHKGYFYNWFAVNDKRGLCPVGWRIPTMEDYAELLDFLGGEKVAGKKMKNEDGWNDFEDFDKETGESKGQILSGNGTNESGFSALPDGRINSKGKFEVFDFDHSCYWTSTEWNKLFSIAACLYSHADYVNVTFFNKDYGMFVRCIED
jgi:uncharacterized protein (TIGR02145 family)